MVEEIDTSTNVAVGRKSRILAAAVFITGRESLLAVGGTHQPSSNPHPGGSLNFGDGTDAAIHQWPFYSMIGNESERPTWCMK